MGQAIASRAMLAVRHPATIVAVVVAAAFGVAVLVHPSTWATFTAMAGGDKETLRQLILGFGLLAPLASVALNVAQAVVAPIPGFVVPFVNGAVFGTWQGMLITWAGGIAAACTCFWIARTFGRRFAERICSRFAMAEEVNRKLERHGFFAIVLARFVPGVPFDFLSYFAGLTRVAFAPFVLATAIGSAPHAYLYAFMGSSLQLPLWLGLLMTPALALTIAGARAVARLLRASFRRKELPGAAREVARLRTVPVADRGRRPSDWIAAPAPAAACLARRPATLPARGRRRQAWRASAPSAPPQKFGGYPASETPDGRGRSLRPYGPYGRRRGRRSRGEGSPGRRSASGRALAAAGRHRDF